MKKGLFIIGQIIFGFYFENIHAETEGCKNDIFLDEAHCSGERHYAVLGHELDEYAVRAKVFAFRKQFSLNRSFEVRLLNYHDNQEIQQVTNLFAQNDVAGLTCLFDWDLQEGEKIFVCIDPFRLLQKVVGVLYLSISRDSILSEIKYVKICILTVHADYEQRSIGSLLVEYGLKYCLE